MQFPAVEVKTQYVRFQGGIDRETPVLSIDPGALLDGMNVQPGLFGGVERVDAFERYDGRARPSDATYWIMDFWLGDFFGSSVSPYTLLVGQTITGDSSGASGVIAYMSTGLFQIEMVLTKVTGTFLPFELVVRQNTGLPLLLNMNSAAEEVGYILSQPELRGYAGAEDDAIALNAAADIYRDDIGPVPGSGPVRGVHVYNGVLYAFRDDVLGAYSQMWKATSTGWVQIQMGEEIAFTGGTDLVLDGDTLTQGTATAQIARVVQTTTAASPSRVGRLILTGRSGNFYVGPATTSSGGTLTISDLTP